MRAKSTMPFNSMGVIAPEAGMIIDTENEIIFNQLKFMGFIQPLENEVKEESKTEAKRAKKK